MMESDSEMEFRSYLDDAWYSVWVVRQRDELRVKYCNFPDDHDDVFEASKFDSLEKLEEFRCRFRPVSLQLQDGECSKVVEGLYICASNTFNGSDVRFYDAVVENVLCKNHSFVNGEELCLCSFIILWQHGPHAMNLAEKKVENICLVQSNTKLDPTVASFLDIAMEKIGKKCPKLSVSQTSRLKVGWIGNLYESNKQDTDFGGLGNHLTILLENLEKELSPSTINEFIHRQTSITAQAYVSPSLSSELYARGAIVLTTEKDLANVYGFLNNPGHIIVSSTGRPWVVATNVTRQYISRASKETSMLKYQKFENNNTGMSHELKLVLSGTEEYRKAKELRDLFMEFSSHQERLHKMLAMEEKKILQQSSAL